MGNNFMETKIYCFLCNKTGIPVYVGKTTMLLKRRIDNHVGSAKRKPSAPFHKWLNKNLNNFKVIVLETVTFDLSSKAEVRWIKRLNARYPLYNAKHYSFGNPGIGRVKWNDNLLSLLGVMNDNEISAMIGCSRKTVSYKREQLRIPPKGQDRGASQRKHISDADMERLGRVPDYILATEAGVSKNYIWALRRKHNIKPYSVLTGNDGRIKIGEAHRRWR